jgi:hypothetical protein
MVAARTRLFHAIVGLGLGVTAGVACGSSVEQSTSTEGTGGVGGAGGAATTTGSGSGGAATTTTVVASSSSNGSGGAGGGIVIDAGPDDAQQTWDVIPIK